MTPETSDSFPIFLQSIFRDASRVPETMHRYTGISQSVEIQYQLST
jgi:hypothetical protein